MDKRIWYLVGIMFILIGIICVCFCIGAKDVRAESQYITGNIIITSNNNIEETTQSLMKCSLIDYPNMFCNDGYVYNRNDYKIVHISQINEWMQSNNDGVSINGLGWYNQIKNVSFEW